MPAGKKKNQSRRSERMSKDKQTLLRLIAGNLLYAAVVSGIGAFIVQDAMRFTLGVFLSAIGASVVAVHLYCSLQKSIDMGEYEAARRETKQAAVRMCITIAVVGFGLLNPQWFHPLGVVLGMFALKISAYVQPFFVQDAAPAYDMEAQEQDTAGMGGMPEGGSPSGSKNTGS